MHPTTSFTLFYYTNRSYDEKKDHVTRTRMEAWYPSSTIPTVWLCRDEGRGWYGVNSTIDLAYIKTEILKMKGYVKC